MQIDLSLDDLLELRVALQRDRVNVIDRMGKAHMLWHSNNIKDQLTKQLVHIDNLRDRVLAAIRSEKSNADVQDM